LLDELVLAWRKEQADLVTPVFPILNQASLHNPNVVKVARTRDGQALYFSRSPIPFVRDLPPERWLESHAFWGHVGVYGYRREVLAAYPRMPESPLETAERLEQLRFLDAGSWIHTIETSYRSIAVDTREDLERVRDIIQSKGYG
jgi:3-deoxy-manno-octulosonate cytidylyltransferase (CMP-KDO synthetase)